MMGKKTREIVYGDYTNIWSQAETYEFRDHPRRKVFNHMIDTWIRAEFPKDSVIFDLGAGQGILVRCLRDKGFFKSIGVDSSVSQVNENEKFVVEQDVLEWVGHQAENSVDVLCAVDFLEHLTSDELCYFLREAGKLLRSGGCLICHLPNADSPFFGSMRYADLTHELAFTFTSLEQLCGIGEFARYAVKPSGPVGSSLKALSRKLILILFEIFWWVLRAAETGNMRRRYLVTSNVWVKFER